MKGFSSAPRAGKLMNDVTTRTDPVPLAICGNPAIAHILADHIDAGKSDATAYVGPCFADFQGVAEIGRAHV